MSNSVFRDADEKRYYSSGFKGSDDVEDEKLKLEQNLVILVNNKSGKICVDERTLHSLLGINGFFTCQMSMALISYFNSSLRND